MLYVYLASGEEETVPRARSCRVGNRHVLFMDRSGHVVKRFPVDTVLAYASSPMEHEAGLLGERQRRTHSDLRMHAAKN
jgi:hypothetical protein